MAEADLKRVVDIAGVCYPNHPEDMAIFVERLRLFPQGCLVLAEGATVDGYVLSYPWRAGAAPPLNALILGLPAAPDAYYLHDLALMPAARGQGHSLTALARLPAGGLPITLVSVNGTVPFWERHGFVVRSASALESKLSSYGADARFLIRST
jgi:GNAT superfamily N-acetyltransferase